MRFVDVFMRKMLKLLILFCSTCLLTTEATFRPKGVPLSKASLYKENQPFTCLDGSATLPWDKVNDDYCDCRDASDEPGTAACSNGLFFCENKHFKGKYIPSSRVNDGICDCCDGSDEYTGLIACRNDCWEMGKAAREEAERRKKMVEEGHRVYKEYVEQVKATLEAKRQRLDQIATEVADVTAKKSTLEEAKNEAEAPEKEAKERHEKAWEEIRKRREEERTKEEAHALFATLDTNKDGQISVSELQARKELDADSSGDVSVDEVKNYMDAESVDLNEFTQNIFPTIQSVMKKKPEQAKPPAPEEKEEKDEEKNEEDEGTKEEKETPDTPEETPAESKTEPAKPAEEKMPEYDENTRKLIEVADSARKAFEEVESKATALENEKENIKKLLDRDYGPDGAFFKLADGDQCHEFTDREYVYRLCPFRESTQRPKDGGGDTSLGHWGRWSGPEGKLYTEMLYENGQSCWNGPNRSTRVEIHCGSENKIESATEPNRCEYKFVFSTPAACALSPQEAEKEAEHDEL